MQALFEALADRTSEARRLVAQLEAAYRSTYVSPYTIALGYSVLGETGKALDWLEEAYETRAADLIWVAQQPGFDPVRDGAAVPADHRRHGLPEQTPDPG